MMWMSIKMWDAHKDPLYVDISLAFSSTKHMMIWEFWAPMGCRVYFTSTHLLPLVTC